MARPARQFDGDALLTLCLTLLVLTLTLGVPWLAATGWVLVVGLRSSAGPARSRTLVIPGKFLHRQLPDADFQARLAAAARLAEERPDSRILILGGATDSGPLTEAEAGARWLRAQAPHLELDIHQEQASADTLTNLHAVRDLMARSDASSPSPVSLISNRYHLARLGLMARSLDIAHELIAAEPVTGAIRPSSTPRWLLEGLFVFWFLTGRLYARLTKNHRMLDRVT
jgi:uncharacterized SAM-binding protein YcdF (DUF218 family)